MTGILNDNTPWLDGKPQFHPFNRWAAISINGTPMGYLSHFKDETTMHLKKDAPRWLRDVRDAGPWESNAACMNAIMAAFPSQLI